VDCGNSPGDARGAFCTVAGFQIMDIDALLIVIVGSISIVAAVYGEWIEPLLYRRRQCREDRREFEVLPPKLRAQRRFSPTAKLDAF
jgi:hypothetical protein